jgi:hypothetical protein
MQATWSFWSKPFTTFYKSNWTSELHHCLSWILSLETAREHYPDTVLYTDDDGARMLIDGLGLEFARVFTTLNDLRAHDPRWWCLGKLYTYRLQTEPFFHLDDDAYLWHRLNPRVEQAQVLAQNPEPFEQAMFYRPEEFEFVVKGVNDGWLPREWEWYRAFGGSPRGECCGIFGGTNLDFIRYYADTAIRFIEHPANQLAWAMHRDIPHRTTLIEQFFLTCCLEYHQHRPASAFHQTELVYLFDSMEEALSPDRAAEVGFTHLMGYSKVNPEIMQRLEARIQRDYPCQFERCVAWLRDTGRLEASA